MLVCICTSDLQESRTINISNLLQLINYLENNEPELWDKIKDKKLAYAVVDSTERYKEQVLRPEIFSSDLSNYDILVIAEKVEGEALFAGMAAAVSAAAFTAAGGVAAGSIAVTAAMIGTAVGYVAAAVIMIGISMAIGAIVQMLSPTNTINSDPSSPGQAQKNYTFNGIPNIREQGGAVPMIFGECLFGGVLVSADLYTSSNNLTSATVASVAEAGGDSTWYRVVVV
jgi:predicted phage tail protein